MILFRKIFILIVSIVSPFTMRAIDTTYAQILIKKSWSFKDTYPDSLLYFGQLALHESSTLGWKAGEAQSYTRIAHAYKKMGLVDSAYQNYFKGLQIREKIGPPEKLSGSYLNLAILFKEIGLYDSSANYFQLALSQAIISNKDSIIADIRMSLGNLYLKMNDYPSANEQYKKAEVYYSRKGSVYDQAQIKMCFGNLLIQMEKWNDAFIYISQSSDLYKKASNKIGEANSLNSLGIIYSKLGEIEKANSSYDSSLQHYESLHNVSGTSSVLINKAGLAIDFSKYDEAEDLLNKALAIVKNAHELETEFDIYKNLISVYAAQKNQRLLINAIDAKDSINNLLISNEKVREIYNLQFQFEIQKQILENKSLVEKNATEKLEKHFYISVAIFLAIVIITGSFLFLQQRRLTRRKSLLAQQQIESLLNDQELKSINAMLEGQDNERKRIAEDLHDRVGSILSTVKLYFGSLNTKIDTYQDENKKQYDQANTLLDEAVQEVRRISHNLISGILMKFGLVPALKDLCDTVEGTQQLKINLKVFNVDERMDGQTEISIYRIIQELLSNVLKHAKATEITISLTRNDGNLNIIVEDNGKGFDANMNYEGIGLKNIRSRVEKLNGQVKFDSVIDRGTTVIIDLPVDETPNEV